MTDRLNPDGIYVEGRYVSHPDDLVLTGALLNAFLDVIGSPVRRRVIIGEADSILLVKRMTAEQAMEKMKELSGTRNQS